MSTNAAQSSERDARRRDLRRDLRQRRQELSGHERHRHGRAMSRAISALPLFHNSHRIALFMPNDGEMDPRTLMRLAHAMHKQCYLPVLAGSVRRPGLCFVRFVPGQPLRANRFGIPEPVPRPGHVINPRFLDLVMTPLVAFDDAGNRLGMGGGYYDRSFAFLRLRRHWHHPRLVGVAYEFQRVPSLPHQPWDVPLSGVVTEAGFHDFRGVSARGTGVAGGG